MKWFAFRRSVLRRYKPGHSVRLLKNGDETFPAMLEAIQSAQKTIYLETYIIRADRTGKRFAKALIEKARQGVEVKLLFDSVGSFDLTDEFLQELRDAGIETAEYNPLRKWWRFSLINKRNHRKSLIVDGKVAFVGGINIADEYASLADGGKGWRDTHLRIEGPTVIELEKLFLFTFGKTQGTIHRYRRFRFQEEPAPSSNPGGVRVRILVGKTLEDRKSIRTAYLRAILRSRERIWITNSYFLPDAALIRALGRAARRGVDVSIISGGTTSDVPWVGFAGRAVYGKLLRRGIHLYDWKENVLHAKTAVVDGVWSTVGSYNLDYRSLLHNLELNAGVIDEKLGSEVEAMFKEDLKKATEITYQDWKNRSRWSRVKDWIAYRFRFLL